MRLMMVCTGNICRSAMAEVVAKAELERRGITGVEVDSCGISDEEYGNPIDRRAAQVLREAGYEVPNHHAKQVRESDFEDVDVFLAMTSSHYSALARMRERLGYGPGEGPAIRMYRELATATKRPLPPGQRDRGLRSNLDVDDPWYGDYQDFLATFDIVQEVSAKIVELAERGELEQLSSFAE